MTQTMTPTPTTNADCKYCQNSTHPVNYPERPWDLRLLSCIDDQCLVSWRAHPDRTEFWFSLDSSTPYRTETFGNGIKEGVREVESGLYESEFSLVAGTKKPLSLSLMTVDEQGRLSRPRVLPGGLFRIIPDYAALELMLASTLDQPFDPVVVLPAVPPPHDLRLESSDDRKLKLAWKAPRSSSKIDGYVCEVTTGDCCRGIRVFVNPRIGFDGWIRCDVPTASRPFELVVASVQREPFRRSEFVSLDTSTMHFTPGSMIGIGVDSSFARDSDNKEDAYTQNLPYDFHVDRYDCGPEFDHIFMSWRCRCDEYIVRGRSIIDGKEIPFPPRTLVADAPKHQDYVRRFEFKVPKESTNKRMELRLRGKGPGGSLSAEVVVPLPTRQNTRKGTPHYRELSKRIWASADPHGSAELISTANLTPLVTDLKNSDVPTLFRYLSMKNVERAQRSKKRSLHVEPTSFESCWPIAKQKKIPGVRPVTVTKSPKRARVFFY